METIDQSQQGAAAAMHLDVVPQPQKEGKLWTLTGFDMVTGTVAVDAWEKYTPAQVLEVLSRCDSRQGGFMMLRGPAGYAYYTGVYVFQTREGAKGLLQVLEGTEKPQTLTVEFRVLKKS